MTPLLKAHYCRQGFTLVELTIVIAVLAILAALVVPKLQGHTDEAAVRTIQTNLRAIQTQVDAFVANHGQHPADLSGTWFVGGTIPEHPHNTMDIASHQTLAGNYQHPGNKVLKSGVLGAYWYNPDNAVVRARVADVGTEAETLALYNEINGSDETTLGNYGSGGGGGGS